MVFMTCHVTPSLVATQYLQVNYSGLIMNIVVHNISDWCNLHKNPQDLMGLHILKPHLLLKVSHA